MPAPPRSAPLMGGQRQLRDHPVADRARAVRRARRCARTRRRRRLGGRRPARGVGRRLPRGAPAGGGDDPDGDPRARRRRRGACRVGRAEPLEAAVRARRAGRCRTPASSGFSAMRASSTRAVRACSSSFAASPRPLPTSPSRRRRRAAEPALDAVHQEPSRNRYCTTSWSKATGRRASAGNGARAPGRLAARRWRPRGAQDPRSHRRPGAALSLGTGVGTIEASRSPTCTASRQREHVSSRRSPAAPRAPGWSPWSQARAPRLFEALGAERMIEGGQTRTPPRPTCSRRWTPSAPTRSCCCPTTRTSSWPPTRFPGRRKAGPCRADRVDSRGAAALVAFNAERSAEENAATMNEAAQHVATAE